MNEHDDWLRVALRHAPDADVAPPAALRAAILAQARANVPPPRSLRARIEALLGALVRPPLAAGLASLMVCTVLAVLWNRGALDEALDPQPQARSPAAEPAALPVPAGESPSAAAAAASPARVGEGDATRSARKPSQARRETAAAQPYASPADAPPLISSSAPATAQAPAPAPEPALAPAREPAPATAPSHAPATAQAPPAPQADPEPPAALRAESRARAAAQERDTVVRRQADPAPSAVDTWAPTASPVVEAAFDPLQALRRRAASDDGALQWTFAGRARVHAEDQRAWLAALDAAAAGRWQRDDEPAAADAATLRLHDGQRLLAEFALGTDRVRVALPGRGGWVAVLEPGQLAQLRATAQRW